MADPEPDAIWRSGDLARAVADLATGAAALRTLEAEYSALGGRADFDSDVARQRLQPQIARSRMVQQDRQRTVTRWTEVEAVVNRLLPIWQRQDRTLRRQVAGWIRSFEVPNRAEAVALYQASHVHDTLRVALYTATQDPALARRYDAPEELRRGWLAQQQDRERMFSHSLSRHHLPRPPAPEWAADAAALTALAAAVPRTHSGAAINSAEATSTTVRDEARAAQN